MRCEGGGDELDLIYQLALFLHIVGAFGLVAVLTLESVGQRGLRQAQSGDAARAAIEAMRLIAPLGAGSGLLILATGLYMTATNWGLQGWIVVGLGGLILNALAGAIVIRNRMQIIGPVAVRASGPLTAEAREVVRDPLLQASLRLRIGIVLGVLFVMTIKPSALLSVIVIVIAGLLGLLTAQLAAGREHHELGGQNG
jgi:hypothetical protein